MAYNMATMTLFLFSQMVLEIENWGLLLGKKNSFEACSSFNISVQSWLLKGSSFQTLLSFVCVFLMALTEDKKRHLILLLPVLVICLSKELLVVQLIPQGFLLDCPYGTNGAKFQCLSGKITHLGVFHEFSLVLQDILLSF